MIIESTISLPFQRGIAIAKPAIEFTISPRNTVIEVTRIVERDVSDGQESAKRRRISQELHIRFKRGDKHKYDWEKEK
jgi:hypothetical protein